MKNVILTTTENLSDQTYQYICDGFKERYSDKLNFRHVIDNSIIGGFIANVSGEIFDLSVLTQLNEMKKHITK